MPNQIIYSNSELVWYLTLGDGIRSKLWWIRKQNNSTNWGSNKHIGIQKLHEIPTWNGIEHADISQTLKVLCTNRSRDPTSQMLMSPTLVPTTWRYRKKWKLGSIEIRNHTTMDLKISSTKYLNDKSHSLTGICTLTSSNDK